MNLFRECESKFGPVAEAIGGAGATDAIRFENGKTHNEKRKRIISVELVELFEILWKSLLTSFIGNQ